MSSSSGRSNHSLRSKGAVDASEIESAEKSRQRKVPAFWTEDEERALVLYLQQQAPAAGDGLNFSKKHFNSVSQHLKTLFPVQLRGEKNGSACQSKWNTVSLS